VRLRPASAQFDQDPCCPLSVSLLVIGFGSEQHGSWSDCAEAQAGLDPCWSQRHYVGFVVTRLIYRCFPFSKTTCVKAQHLYVKIRIQIWSLQLFLALMIERGNLHSMLERNLLLFILFGITFLFGFKSHTFCYCCMATLFEFKMQVYFMLSSRQWNYISINSQWNYQNIIFTIARLYLNVNEKNVTWIRRNAVNTLSKVKCAWLWEEHKKVCPCYVENVTKIVKLYSIIFQH
jgi:hypothetical protein